MLTAQQREERRSGIGGSDASAVAGVSKYKTPLDVYLSKIGMKDDSIDNPNIQVGNKLEPILRTLYMERTGQFLDTPDETYRHIDHNFMLANVDGIIGSENAILECKTAGIHMAKFWGDVGSDEIPTEYLLQCAHYAEVMNAAYVDIAVSFLDETAKHVILNTDDVGMLKLVAGIDYRVYRYRPHKTLHTRLVGIESQFWFDSVQKHLPPTPISQADALKLWPRSSEGTIIADLDDYDTVSQLKDIREQIKALEGKEAELRSAVCKKLQDAALLLGTNGERLASWKSQEANRFDVSSFKGEHPELYSKFVKTSESRVLRIP